MNHDEISYMVMIYPLGYIVADLVSCLLDKIGRKYYIMIISILQIIAWVIIANADAGGMAVLFVGRFLAGISEGATYLTLPIYICEIADPEIRGMFGMSYTSAFVFGVFLINWFGSFVHLRLCAYISIYVPVLFLMTFTWMPESPYFLLMKGNTEAARQSLRVLKRRDDVEDELNKLSLVIQRQISRPSSIKHVFLVKSNLKAFSIVIGLRTLQQLSGGWAIVYYNQIIFQVAGGSLSYEISSIIFDATLVLVSFSGLVLIDRFGRRILLLVSCIGIFICLLFQAIYFALQYHKYDLSNWRWFPLTAMVMYTASRGFGLMAIPSLMAAELFSTNVKVKAVAIANVYMAFCISLTAKLFQFLEVSYGMYVPFSVFVVCTGFGIFFVYLYIPETKGKTLEEIQEWLEGNSEQD